MNFGPIVAALLGLPWLGMILNHQFSKGMVVLAVTVGATIAAVLFGTSSPLMLLVTILAGIAGYVIGLLDVISIAQRYARCEDVREWDWF